MRSSLQTAVDVKRSSLPLSLAASAAHFSPSRSHHCWPQLPSCPSPTLSTQTPRDRREWAPSSAPRQSLVGSDVASPNPSDAPHESFNSDLRLRDPGSLSCPSHLRTTTTRSSGPLLHRRHVLPGISPQSQHTITGRPLLHRRHMRHPRQVRHQGHLSLGAVQAQPLRPSVKRQASSSWFPTSFKNQLADHHHSFAVRPAQQEIKESRQSRQDMSFSPSNDT